MSGWQKALAHLVSDVEAYFDRLKYRLSEHLGGRDAIMILPYLGFVTEKLVFLKGRVLENKDITPAEDNDSVWENLVNMYRRFESDEIPFARLLARFQGVEQEVQADEEGYFEVRIEFQSPLQPGQLWQSVALEMLEPRREGEPPARAEGQVMVISSQAEFGVISDIDDTVVHTEATRLLRMARNVFLSNARTRLPFKGVAAFYRALLRGAQGRELNPIFYVSSSPWNLYDLIIEYFQLQKIPAGPMLFLRDWGITSEELLPLSHRDYKLQAIERILELVPGLPFILIGDSGQEDPEIYHAVMQRYPQRILAIYIRDVSQDEKRRQAIQALAQGATAAGIMLILAEDTLPMAEHAAGQGWIDPAALLEIREEKRKDEAPLGLLEQALEESD